MSTVYILMYRLAGNEPSLVGAYSALWWAERRGRRHAAATFPHSKLGPFAYYGGGYWRADGTDPDSPGQLSYAIRAVVVDDPTEEEHRHAWNYPWPPA